MKKYKISFAEGSDERLKGALGYEGEHAVEFTGHSFKFFYENNLDDANANRSSLIARVKEIIFSNKDSEVVVETQHHPSRQSASVAAALPFSVSMYALLVKEAMQEIAPDASYSFAYTLENPAPNVLQGDNKPESTLWETNFVLSIGPGLDNDFSLVTRKKEIVQEPDPKDKNNTVNVTKIKTLSRHPISIEEVIDLEKIPEDSVEQRQEAPTGTD